MASHHLGFVAGQIDGSPGDIIRFSHGAQRDLPAQLFQPGFAAHGVGDALQDRRVDEHRVDAVAGDAIFLLGTVQRHALGQVAHGGLGAVVGGAVVGRDHAGDAGKIDDAAAHIGFAHGARHGRQAQLAAEEHAVQIDAVHALPGVEIGGLYRRAARDAGIVDQHVESAELFLGKGNSSGPVFGAGHIMAAGHRGITDAGRHGLHAGFVDVGQHHAGAFFHHAAGHRLAQALCCASDQCHLACQSVHVIFPLVFVVSTTLPAPRPAEKL